jgi:hypothetical protein
MLVQHTSPNKVSNIILIISCFLLINESNSCSFFFCHLADLELGGVVNEGILGGEPGYHSKTWRLSDSGITSSFINPSICCWSARILCGPRHRILRLIFYKFRNERRVISMYVGTKMTHKPHMHPIYIRDDMWIITVRPCRVSAPHHPNAPSSCTCLIRSLSLEHRSSP